MQNPLQAFWLRPRLLIAIAVVVALTILLPVDSLWSRLLIAWCTGVLVYLALAVRIMTGLPLEDLRRQSSALDDSAPVISLFAVVATVASVGAVAMLIAGGSEHDSFKAAHVVLAAATMVCSWLFVQFTFAIHYTHVFYGDTSEGDRRGGLEFSGETDPDFWDFLYFTITIGATSQTSDTDVSSKRMRRIVTAHGTYSYFFNTSVLAFAVNIATGLAGH